MNFLNLVLIFTWLIRTLDNLLYQVYIWQLKEYRLDRIRAHLDLPQGKQWLINPFTIMRLFLFFASPLLVRQGRDGLFFFVLVLALFSGEAFVALKRLFSQQLRRPKFTIKAVLITGGGGLVQILPLGSLLVTPLSPGELALLLLALSTSLPIIIGAAVAVFVPASRFAKKRIIEAAERKIRSHPDLTVVGITGSYGKTSTKEFLKVILSEKFSVLSTAEHHNTDIGVARCVLDNLKESHQIFIVEMGAYKTGEIADICKIVKPKIGVITGINQQHLALFGSMKDLLEAKYELIEALPKEGLAIFNGDNSYCLDFYRKTKIKKMLYSQKRKGEVRAGNITVEKDSLRFEVMTKRNSKTFKAPLIGQYNISNILAATSVALSLGMNLKEIAKVATKLKAISQTMVVFPGPNGSTLIDDTYNANPDGVMAALEHLRHFSGKKYLIMQPMIELGGASLEAHRKVGKMAVKTCNQIFLTNKNFLASFYAEVSETGKKKIMTERDPEVVVSNLKKALKRGDVVLFEGKEAEKFFVRLKA